MTDDKARDELIEQARRVLDMAAWDDETYTMSAARGLIDAGWRPPPSGDELLERAAQVIYDGQECTADHHRDEGHDACREVAVEAARVMARSGLLATPARQDEPKTYQLSEAGSAIAVRLGLIGVDSDGHR